MRFVAGCYECDGWTNGEIRPLAASGINTIFQEGGRRVRANGDRAKRQGTDPGVRLVANALARAAAKDTITPRHPDQVTGRGPGLECVHGSARYAWAAASPR